MTLGTQNVQRDSTVEPNLEDIFVRAWEEIIEF